MTFHNDKTDAGLRQERQLLAADSQLDDHDELLTQKTIVAFHPIIFENTRDKITTDKRIHPPNCVSVFRS